ncbi:MAG: hypothetical protein NZ989_01660 [Bacteroidia bacterium]|nr:hypothetical protein [Bacteroidia bacterium]MDW8056825.1 hypothetical protein [Bacteroidia bacterium]
MHRGFLLLIGLLYAQSSLTMGARLQVARSQLHSPTDQTSPWTALSPTYKAGIVGFFGWGWTPYLATSIELSYQGVGQRYYGIGLRGESYTSEISLHYLRTAVAIQSQYAQKNWGAWVSFSPGLSFLTQVDLDFQGDSLPQGTTLAPQLVRKVLGYLEQSTNPDDRLILIRMYRRAVPSFSASGGLRVRLSPAVWILGLLYYERSFGDLERKDFRLRGEETPLYDPQRKSVQYQLTGIQLGLQYEISIRP